MTEPFSALSRMQYVGIEDCKVLLMGDFNRHMQVTKSYLDHNGQLLLCCAEHLFFEILNTMTTVRALLSGKS